jgi:hypothetical protein
LYPEQPYGAPANQPWSAPPVPSGPPVSGAPQAGAYGYQQPPQQPQMPPAPQAPQAPRSIAFPLLIALAVVLLMASIGTVIIGVGQISDLRSQVTSLKSERDAAKKADDAAKAKVESDFAAADLPGKLQKVKDLDKAAEDKFAAWKAGTAKFGELHGAMQACDDQVAEYDRTAAKFPATKFNTELPQIVDTGNRDTDCGRGFLNNI